MEKETKNAWKTYFMIACIVIVVLIICIIVIISAGNDKAGSSANKGKIRYGNQDYSSITLEENLSISGDIENLEGVRWQNARISQNAGDVQVSVTINNDNPDQKVESKQLKIELLDIDGNILAEGNSQIQGLSESTPYINIDFSVGIPIPEVIYNIRIIAE